jgi:transposase
LAIERAQMRRLDKTRLPAVWSYRTRKKVFGVERTVLVTLNRPLLQTQRKTLRREIDKRRRKLKALQASLARHAEGRAGGRLPTLEGTRKRVQAILVGRHIKDLFEVTVSLDAQGLPTLQWSFRTHDWDHLQRTLLGKTLLFTDREAWTDEQIVRAYRSQSHVEAAFRRMKDPHVLTFRPIHHWTDQKLRVHALICVLALMILTLLRRKLEQAGVSLSIASMIERLSGIQEVSVLFPTAKGALPRASTVLSDLDAEQHALFQHLNLACFRSA